MHAIYNEIPNATKNYSINVHVPADLFLVESAKLGLASQIFEPKSSELVHTLDSKREIKFNTLREIERKYDLIFGHLCQIV